MLEITYIVLIAAQFIPTWVITLTNVSLTTAWILIAAQIICAIIQGIKFPSFSLRTASNANLGLVLATMLMKFYFV